MENTNLKMNGKVIPVSAFGKADAELQLHIQNGIAPYRIELKINDTNPVNQWNAPFFRTIEDIPAPTTSLPDDYNCIIGDLPPGGYKFRIYDSGDPSIENPADGGQQMNIAFTSWNAVSPPYATLNGTVNPLGLETHVYFDYGTGSTYDHEAQYGMINGTDTITCSLQLSSGDYNNTSILTPNTLYHYRIRATNSAGTSYGEDMTFITPTSMAIVITLPATNIS